MLTKQTMELTNTVVKTVLQRRVPGAPPVVLVSRLFTIQAARNDLAGFNNSVHTASEGSFAFPSAENFDMGNDTTFVDTQVGLECGMRMRMRRMCCSLCLCVCLCHSVSVCPSLPVCLSVFLSLIKFNQSGSLSLSLCLSVPYYLSLSLSLLSVSPSLSLSFSPPNLSYLSSREDPV